MRKRLATATAGSILAAIFLIAPIGTASAGGGGCFHGTAPTVGNGTEVDMVDDCFEATVLRVQPGSEVSWTNRDAVEHTVTGVGGTWGSLDVVTPGASVTYSFADDGVFLYSCLIHPGMVGAVVVGSGRGDAGLQPDAAVAVTGAGDGPVGPQSGESPAGGPASWLVGGAVGIVLGLGIAGTLIARRRTFRVA